MSVALVEETATTTRYMVNPFKDLCSDEYVQAGTLGELSSFMTWAHTLAQPLDADFVSSLQNITQWAKHCRALPNDLQEGGNVLSKLDIAIALLVEERERLKGLYRDFDEQRRRLTNVYSEEEAVAWLGQHMPQAYAYARLLSSNLQVDEETPPQAPQ